MNTLAEQIIRLTPEKRTQLFHIMKLRDELEDLRMQMRGLGMTPEAFREAKEARLTAEYQEKAREHDRLIDEFHGDAAPGAA